MVLLFFCFFERACLSIGKVYTIKVNYHCMHSNHDPPVGIHESTQMLIARSSPSRSHDAVTGHVYVDASALINKKDTYSDMHVITKYLALDNITFL